MRQEMYSVVNELNRQSLRSEVLVATTEESESETGSRRSRAPSRRLRRGRNQNRSSPPEGKDGRLQHHQATQEEQRGGRDGEQQDGSGEKGSGSVGGAGGSEGGIAAKLRNALVDRSRTQGANAAVNRMVSEKIRE